MTIGLFFEFHFPLSLVTLLQGLINFKNFDPKNPATPVDTSTREWFSHPRPGTDQTVEVVQVQFKLPLSISEISAEVTRSNQRVEIWYKDRSNNWLQMRDRQRAPLAFAVSSSNVTSWYKYSSVVYPIVAKAVQIRQVRNPDSEFVTSTNRPYSLGLRNTLIKRNVYERNQGVQFLEEEQDVLGNVISKYIKDWDASKAVDGDSMTYWKSAPMPDPDAVVSMYLDVRSPTGGEQAMDSIYIEPVHSGSHLNIYTSSDDTVADRKLSPIQIVPDVDQNTDWRLGRGRWDISGITNLPSNYQFSGAWGPQAQKDLWFGTEWVPDFDPLDGPSSSVVLLKTTSAVAQAYAPEVVYEPGEGAFKLTFRRGTDSPISFSAPMSKLFVKGEPVRLVAGWAYNPKRIILKVVNRKGEILAQTTGTGTLLPDLISIDAGISFARFRGMLVATVLKFEDWAGEIAAFFANPTTYVSPDPVLPDDNGKIPPSSLDNAIYSADWTQQQHGVGGVDHTEYSSKEWVPVWSNFVAEKGRLFLPQMVMAKFLKLEFTNLTEEPYPIYESGIDVSYKVFPVSVQQVSTLGPRLYTGKDVGGLFGQANLNGVKSVNWFSPSSVINAVTAVILPQTEPVRIDTGPGYVTNTIPNQRDSPITKSYRAELSQSAVYRREELNPYILASDQYYTVIKGEGLQKLAPYTNIPWAEIQAANPGAISTSKQLGALPVRGTDWWLFPGQQLKIPAAVMSKLTSTSTVTERRATLESRVRFTTTAVHRYETRTLRRDAAIAYFAGVREIVPLVSSNIFGQDKEQFDFAFYTPEQWVWTDMVRTPNGPVTKTPESKFGSMFFSLQTRSKFAKVEAVFRDSGLLRSDALWASASSDNLSPNASVIPANLDGSAWLDSFAGWADDTVAWGAPRGVVAVNLDADRRYQGRRVLKFSRAPGAGEAGIELKQATNFIGGGLVRLGTVVYKPFGNTNIALLRLLRRKDNRLIYETPIELTAGRWTDFTTDLVDIPENLPMAAPVVTKGTTATSGGTFAAGAYFWKVTAYNSLGETLGSNQISATLAASGTQYMSWPAVAGAAGYRVYRGTATNAQNVRVADTASLNFTDTGVAGTAATVPTVNGSGGPQEYKVQLVLTGDKEDELYVSDLYSEIAGIRYYMQVGGSGAWTHDVTDLRYKDSAAVVAPTPVNQANVRAVVLSPKFYAYGATLRPAYLQ